MEVNRNCVSPEAPKGTCSFLYSRSMKVWQSMGGKKLITYTLETESGASLRATNFKQKAVTQPFKKGTGWTTRKGREWQKVQLIPRIRWEWKVWKIFIIIGFGIGYQRYIINLVTGYGLKDGEISKNDNL